MRAGDVRLSRGNGNFVTGKLGDTEGEAYAGRKSTFAMDFDDFLALAMSRHLKN